jgi:hypothetical protein
MPTNTRTNTQGKDQQVITGIQKDLSTMSSLPLGGETFTPVTLMAFVQSRIDAANQVVVAKANWQNAAKIYATINTKATIVVHDLKQLVIGAFGATSSKLADFGFTPRKVVVLTPDQKVAAAAKRAATRKARGTLGPKAKLAVTGTVAPTAPATTAKPAAPAAVPAAPAAAPPATPPYAAPPAALTATPPAASATAPAPAPTVTVNVTNTPAAQVGVSPATATTPAPEPAPVAPPATVAAPAPAKS